MILIEPIRNGQYIKDGAYALAIQMWALHNLKISDKTIIFPYIADAHVQIGYFQNPEVEVNQPYVQKHKIPIVRRDTGGGAIFIDDKAVNICFLIPTTRQNGNVYPDYSTFYKPIISALEALGVKALVQGGKNDLTINGKKVSGAAMLQENNLIYAGCSLLYEIDWAAMLAVLKPNRQKMLAKGIKSIQQRVDSLKNKLDPAFQHLNIFEFKDAMIKHLTGVTALTDIERYNLSASQWAAVDTLVKDKYQQWDWVYGMTPPYEYNREMRLEIGTVAIALTIENGKIKNCKITGDFFARKDLTPLEKGLEGCKMIKQNLRTTLQTLDLSSYFWKPVSEEQFVEMMLS